MVQRTRTKVTVLRWRGFLQTKAAWNGPSILAGLFMVEERVVTMIIMMRIIANHDHPSSSLCFWVL
jgi:hypothetical protein